MMCLQKYTFLFLILIFSHTVQAQLYSFKFQDPSLSIGERVEDLIAQMTLEEKAAQLRYETPAMEHLGINEYNWWNECLHGVARNGRATVFPQAIGLAATFDTALIYRIGRAISMEARAKYNVSSEHGLRGRYQGLTFWTPNINIFRDPRWGRGQETYGEDPYLTSRIGVSFVRGLQGNNPKYLQAAGMAKHFAVHSGPEKLRHEFDAKVSRRDLWETYLPAFEALVKEAKVEGVMGAYNRVNGAPCCAHPYLMQEVLREKWGFKGYFVSDCWALVDFYAGHKLVKTSEEAAAMALNGGTNLNCGSTYLTLVSSVKKGLTNEKTIDDNLRILLPTRFKLGLFDPRGTVPFDTISTAWIRSKAHVALSLEAAEKSIVLLKNKNNLLPLRPSLNSVFVTGPTAAHTQALLGNYYGVSEDLKTILEGIVANVQPHTQVKYIQGALLDEPNRNPIDWFSEEAAESEVTIVCLGNSQLMEGEEGESIMSRNLGDRVDIALPQNQLDFLKKIRSKTQNLVVVITGGSPIACPEVLELADALVFVWYPGEQGGMAVGNVLFGKTIPSGKLPVTFPKSVNDLPPYAQYSMENRTYKYMEKEPLFPFGFGLSYTKFEYSDLTFSEQTLSKNDSIQVSANLSNRGGTNAEEVVQLYISAKNTKEKVPKYALKAFQRVALKTGETKTIQFILHSKDFELINEAGESMLEAGIFEISVGGSVPSQRSIDLGASPFVHAEVNIL